jgi:hypothetical protein
MRRNMLNLHQIFFTIRCAIRADNADTRICDNGRMARSVVDKSVTGAKHCRSGTANHNDRHCVPIRAAGAGVDACQTRERAPHPQRPFTVFL